MTKTVDNLTDPAFVVFGIDADKKPRAARFDNSQPELVAKAAELMNLKLYEVNSPAVAALAKKLPNGRLYANGNGFVPPVKRDLYTTLAAVIAASKPERRSPRCRWCGDRSWLAWTAAQLGRDRAGPPGHRQRRAWEWLVGRDCR